MLRRLSITQSHCSFSKSRALWKSSQKCHQEAFPIYRRRLATVTAWQFKNHYEVLGLTKDASASEIKDAFLKLSKEYHPDLNRSDPNSQEKFVKLNTAYQTLSKPQSRKEYDMSMSQVFHFQQNMARHGYTSHYPSDMPGRMGSQGGPTYQGGDAENKQFWDETIYNMRNRSKEDYYPEDQFYGIKGVKRQSNKVVLFGCLVLISVGALLHLCAVRYSQNFTREVLDKKDRVNLALLKESRARAKLYGNEHQLQELKAKLVAADRKRAAKQISESESPS